jgi:DNA-directed RNA polymerase specialized sigma24 family protein
MRMQTHPPPNNVFPATQYTLIGRMLNDRDRLSACKHVMSVYAEPLRVYFLGSSFRSLGEPDDIVEGFFASRLSRDAFLNDWQTSSRQLRFWLMTAFKHYLFEQVRALKNERQRATLQAEVESPCDRSEHEFHRETALALVREAMRMAEETCCECGFEDHWRVFVRHHVDGRSYEQLHDELGIDQKKFTAMARTAGNKLKAALRELIAWNDASEEDIDREIISLMEVIQT